MGIYVVADGADRSFHDAPHAVRHAGERRAASRMLRPANCGSIKRGLAFGAIISAGLWALMIRGVHLI